MLWTKIGLWKLQVSFNPCMTEHFKFAKQFTCKADHINNCSLFSIVLRIGDLWCVCTFNLFSRTAETSRICVRKHSKSQCSNKYPFCKPDTQSITFRFTQRPVGKLHYRPRCATVNDSDDALCNACFGDDGGSGPPLLQGTMDVVLLGSCFVAARQIESLFVLRSCEPSSHFQVFVVVYFCVFLSCYPFRINFRVYLFCFNFCCRLNADACLYVSNDSHFSVLILSRTFEPPTLSLLANKY